MKTLINGNVRLQGTHVCRDIPAVKDRTKDVGPAEENISTKKTTMTEQQKRKVLHNWAILSRDVPGRGKRIFLEIFRRNPEIKTIFMMENLTEQEILNVCSRVDDCICYARNKTISSRPTPRRPQVTRPRPKQLIRTIFDFKV